VRLGLVSLTLSLFSLFSLSLFSLSLFSLSLSLSLSLCLSLFSPLADVDAAEVFALTVLYCDKYLDIRPWLTSKAESNMVRFFLVASQLPMDLQMTLANRLHDLPKEYIPLARTEEAFRMVLSKFPPKC